MIRLLFLLVDELRPDQAETARISTRIEALAPGRVAVSVEPIQIGMDYYYESAVGLAMAAPGVLHQVGRHQHDVDAIVLGCFGDPGLRAAREISQVPVIGAGEASMVLAQLYARRFGIVHIRASNIGECEAELAALGLSHMCAGMSAIDMAFDEVTDNVAKTRELLARESRLLLSRGAEIIILGCMSLGLGPFTDELAATLGARVINPVRAAIAAAQAFETLRVPAAGQPADFGYLRGYLADLDRVSAGAGLRAWRPGSGAATQDGGPQ